MPIVRVTMMEGYEAETRRRLAQRLTDAVRATIAAPLDGITVAIEEVPSANYMRGRQSRTPGAPLPDAEAQVRSFLEAMEARNLEQAATYLAPDFRMTFPGGAQFSALQDLLDWAKSRYRSVRKSYESFDCCGSETGTVVYCFGTLSGEWPDGRTFEGVRFIDRFEVEGGRIRQQSVWNDLAEKARPAR